jgi:hypothetical protein
MRRRSRFQTLRPSRDVRTVTAPRRSQMSATPTFSTDGSPGRSVCGRFDRSRARSVEDMRAAVDRTERRVRPHRSRTAWCTWSLATGSPRSTRPARLVARGRRRPVTRCGHIRETSRSAPAHAVCPVRRPSSADASTSPTRVAVPAGMSSTQLIALDEDAAQNCSGVPKTRQPVATKGTSLGGLSLYVGPPAIAHGSLYANDGVYSRSPQRSSPISSVRRSRTASSTSAPIACAPTR